LNKSAIIKSSAGYHFKDPMLIKQALSHSSYAEEHEGGRNHSNERMEFLGDAVVGFFVAKIIYGLFPDEEEGVLSRLKAHWVSTEAMAGIAERIGIKEILDLGAGEARSGGIDNPRNLAGALEAVVAAVYLDGGLKNAENLVARLWKGDIKKVGSEALLLDTKTRLQEILQKKYKDIPEYVTTKGSEAFVSEAVFRGKVIGAGKGSSKKKAEQAAAGTALKSFLVKEKKAR
jgi:ribonuclease III